MKKIIFYLILCLPSPLLAQQGPIEYMKAIHFNPLALAQIDYTLLGGMEFKIRPKMSLVTEVGYVFASDYAQHDAESSPARGFIIRPSVRFFVNERRRFYLQPQVFLKVVTHHLHDWLGMDCVNNVPAYEELRDFRYQRRVLGINGTWGMLVPLSKSGNTFMDFYFGVGMRYKNNRIVHEPNACYDNENLMLTISSDSGIVPSIPVGIKLVFALD